MADGAKAGGGEWKATLWRWADMGLLLVVSLVLCAAIQRPVEQAGAWLAAYLLGIHGVVLILALVLLSAMVWLMVIRLGGFRPRDLVNGSLWCYPPTWIVGVAGVMLFIALWPGLSPDRQGVVAELGRWPSLGLAALFLVAGLGVAQAFDALSRPKGKLGDAGAEQKTPTKLSILDWIHSDDPITHPDLDQFERGETARRMARLLRQGKTHTIGLVGPYGSGKSSLLNLLERELQEREQGAEEGKARWWRRVAKWRRGCFLKDRWHICRVEAWGRDPEKFAEQVLRLAVRELGRNVDVASLATMPAHYSAAMSASGKSGLAVLASLLSVSADPLDSLRRLDRILAAVRGRMLVLVEDLDRNASEALLCDTLPALLDRVGQLERVAFVLAIGTERYDAQWLLRICEHKESLSGVDEAAGKKVIGDVRRDCLARCPQVIDCLPSKNREERLADWPPETLYTYRAVGLPWHAPLQCLAALLSNPRLLKHVLRRVDHAWDVLHGEVDIDDLLVMHTLQYAAPEVYAFVLNNLTELRRLDRGTASDHEKGVSALETKWKESVGARAGEEALSLVHFLFPKWKGSQEGVVPQGVQNATPTDYWVRIEKEEVGADEVRDQAVLHAVRRWREDARVAALGSQTLAQACHGVEGFGAKLKQLALDLTGEEVHRLASELFVLILERHGVRAHVGLCDASTRLWHMSLERPWEGHEAWVAREFEKALPTSLRLAIGIYRRWRCGTTAEHQMKSPHPELRRETVRCAKELWSRDFTVFLNALDATCPESLHEFAVTYSEAGTGSAKFDAQEWTWLGSLLAKAAPEHPRLVLPQIAMLLTYQPSNTDTRHAFRHDVGQTMFGTDYPKIMTLLAQGFDTAGAEPSWASIFAFAQEEARKWVRENGGKRRDTEATKGRTVKHPGKKKGATLADHPIAPKGEKFINGRKDTPVARL